MMQSGWLPNRIVAVRIDVGTLLALAGCAVAGVGLAALAARDRWRHASDRRLAEVRAEALDDRRRFLRRLDHELKNPLTAIRADLANLLATAEPSGGESLASLEGQVLRLSRLTENLRKLAELETRLLDRAPVDLGELLQNAVASAEETGIAEGRRLTLTLPQAPWPLPTISGDPDLLFLALYNLLGNGLKFTNLGGTVELRAYEDGASVVVECADTGIGIPADELPHVWEELFRGRDARGVAGSGLGLALVRAIIERHGGQVTLRSRPGQGTVIGIRLPAG